jgi:hypothetical protein
VKISTTMFYTELSTMICPDVAWNRGAQRRCASEIVDDS